MHDNRANHYRKCVRKYYFELELSSVSFLLLGLVPFCPTTNNDVVHGVCAGNFQNLRLYCRQVFRDIRFIGVDSERVIAKRSSSAKYSLFGSINDGFIVMPDQDLFLSSPRSHTRSVSFREGQRFPLFPGADQCTQRLGRCFCFANPGSGPVWSARP